MNVLELSEQEIVRRGSLDEMRRRGIDPFPAAEFPVSGYSDEIKETFADEAPRRDVAIAGRIMGRRIMGKASFLELQDSKGRIQVYVNRDEICPGEDKDLYNVVFKKLLDIGDFVGIKGYVFRTQTGEISVHAQELIVLGKSLRPLPIVKVKDGVTYDAFDDPELRYRRRYVDLIVNDGVKDIFVKRTKVLNSMRKFFNDHGYMEVETPILQSIAGGASARPFITHHNSLNMELYMRIATELPLKRLIVGGMDRVYEIGRIFRNEGMDPKHNPEFTTVELYQAYTDFHGMMDIAEGILSGAAKEILGGYQVEWLGEQIDLTPGWRRMTMVEAVKEHAGVDFGAITDDAEAVAAAGKIGVKLPEAAEKTWGNALYTCFDERVEEKLIQPTFITMYPVEVSPLTKRSPADPRLTERFELFICHSELANAYSELNDPIDQRYRFEKQVEQRERGDEETEMLDEDFLNALEYGMPPTGGMGMGIDRAVMLLTGADSIRDVLLFPTMKPL